MSGVQKRFNKEVARSKLCKSVRRALQRADLSVSEDSPWEGTMVELSSDGDFDFGERGLELQGALDKLGISPKARDIAHRNLTRKNFDKEKFAAKFFETEEKENKEHGTERNMNNADRICSLIADLRRRVDPAPQ